MSADRLIAAPRGAAPANRSRDTCPTERLLFQTLLTSISSRSRSMPGSTSLTTNAATLLIVNDDNGARHELRSVFEGAGHRTIAAEDAPAALRLLQKEPCDLVMLDLVLPDVDGLALCRLMRAQPAMQQLPVIIFSADDS